MKKILYFFFLLLLEIQFAATATEPFRFALITDLHISPADRQSSEDLQNTVIDVNASSGIDFVIIAGDITNRGDLVSFNMAKQMLQKLHMPYYIIPGNHDVKWYETGDTNFDSVYRDTKFVFTHKGIEFIGFTTAPADRSGIGTVQPKDINWLKTFLAKAGKGMPVFAVTHYPLQSGDVDNWKELADLLKEYNVQAVLGGHYHRNALFNYKGIPGIISRSTLRGKDAVGGYSIFSVSDSIRVFEKKTGMPEEKWLTLPMNSLR
ncbi:MAG: metallophosphoesterase [Bacteroidota bacterium]|nr:metallophosphoesterase [Bacteroidota bacterium]